RDLAPTKPCSQEAAKARAREAVMRPVAVSSPSTDDTPTVVRPPTEEELQALSAIRSKPMASAREQPPAAVPRPPPLPARAKARGPPAHAAPPPVVELEIDPEPDSESPLRRGPRALRAAFRVIRGALRPR